MWEEYNTGKGQNLLCAFQAMCAVENLSITQHYFHQIKSFRGVHYLISPSHVHYLIQPREAIFLYIRTSLHYGETTVRELLIKHKPKKTDKLYVFTLDTDIPSFVFAECEKNSIQLVTTFQRKMTNFANEARMMTLERFFEICRKKQQDGQDYPFSSDERYNLNDLFGKRLKELVEFPLLKEGYEKQIDKYEK